MTKAINRKEALVTLVSALLVGALLTVLGVCASGCFYKGAKVTEGTDLAIGLNVPVSEGTLQFQALNYLSGFRLGVDRNAELTCTYSVSESNSYLGVVQTHVTKTMSATVLPMAVTNEADGAEARAPTEGSANQ